MPFIPPELNRTGPEKTVKDGDDFTNKVKKTIGDFLRDQVEDPDIGKKNTDERIFTEETELAKHENTTFFNNLETQDFKEFREVADDFIESGIGASDILSEFVGAIEHGEGSIVDPSQVQPTPETKVIAGSISKIMNSNRFNPRSTYGDQFNDDGQIAVMPTELGEFNAEGAPARLEDLKKVGLSLMLRATGEFINGDPTSQGVSLGSLLPGQAQLGVKIDAKNMHAENVFGAPGVDPGRGPIRARVKDILKGESIRSFGQLNSCNEPFDGFMPLGMTGLAIIMVVALRIVSAGFARLLGLMAHGIGGGSGKLNIDPLTFGQFGQQTNTRGFFKMSDIGIVELDRDWTACVNEGIRTFFDFRPGLLGREFARIARSPGFYANLVRVIVQSAGRIINSVIDAFKTLKTSVVAGATAVLGIIDILKTSKVVAYLNIMGILGDRSFARTDKGIDKAPRGSTIDGMPDNAATRIAKSRVRDPESGEGDITLAWRGSAPISTLLMPISFNQASGKFGNKFSSHFIAQKTLNQGAVKPTDPLGGRYTPDEIAEVEMRLDAEYVPFYFHDLRTNELVSFHAFISSVNESFSPTYGESTPYGRIDPIMTYGNTRRTFSLSFHVVATSHRDFDLMYVKLNKLTSLLYPQWTRGRQVRDENGRGFIQPFSQIPGASPLCRIRLGNLMRTNFSNVALGRLFGLGGENFLDKDKVGVEKLKAEALQKRAAAEIESFQKIIVSNGWPPNKLATIKPTGLKYLNEHASLLPTIFSNSRNDELVKNWTRSLEDPQLVKIKSKSPGKFNYRGQDVRAYVVDFEAPEFKGLRGVVVPEPLLSVTINTLDLVPPINEDVPDTESTSDEQLKFLDLKENAVVRSFQNVQGKGLAGFITSLNIDWNEANGSWDVERFSARAPQLLKLDLSFTVIHDIPPGLDDDGFNRAPIWPIGDVMHNTWGDAYARDDSSLRQFNAIYRSVKGKKSW